MLNACLSCTAPVDCFLFSCYVTKSLQNSMCTEGPDLFQWLVFSGACGLSLSFWGTTTSVTVTEVQSAYIILLLHCFNLILVPASWPFNWSSGLHPRLAGHRLDMA